MIVNIQQVHVQINRRTPGKHLEKTIMICTIMPLLDLQRRHAVENDTMVWRTSKGGEMASLHCTENVSV